LAGSIQYTPKSLACSGESPADMVQKQATPEPRGDVQSDSEVHTFANAGAGTASAADKATADSERPKS
jgi:hypothetical protein